MLPSVKVPVTENCTVVPRGTDGFAGETASETSVGAVTASVTLPLTPDNAAVMVAEPGVLPVAAPTLEMVAMAVFDELQLAEFVRFLLVLSL